MKVSKSSLVLTAAFTGLLGGTMTRLNASTVSSSSAGQGCPPAVRWPDSLPVASGRQRRRNTLARDKTPARARAAARPATPAAGQEHLQRQGRLRHRRLHEENHLIWCCAVARTLLRAYTTAQHFLKPCCQSIQRVYRIRYRRGSPHPPLPALLEKKPVVSWFEIISENFMVDGGRPLAILDQILEQYRVVQHGVSMYSVRPRPLNRDHLRRLKALVKRTKTPWLTTTSAGAAWTAATPTICCRCLTPSKLRNHRAQGSRSPVLS